MVYLGKHTMPVFLFKGWLEALSGDKIKFNVIHRYPAATTLRVYLSCPDCKFGLKYDQVEILDIGNILQLAFSLSEQFQNDMQNSRNLSLLGSMREEEIVSRNGKRRRCSSWLRKKIFILFYLLSQGHNCGHLWGKVLQQSDGHFQAIPKAQY